jgi:hypothetical protein
MWQNGQLSRNLKACHLRDIAPEDAKKRKKLIFD